MAAAQGGFIKLHRRMLEWGWYDDANTMRLFIHLLLTANYKDGVYRGREIKRGQCVFGRKSVSKALGISEQSLRTSLRRLESTSEITTESTNQFTVVTIANYDLYQGGHEPATNESTCDQPAINQQLTSDQPATNHIQEGKKEKKVRNEEILPAASTREVSHLLPIDPDYAEVVQLYQAEIHPVTPTTGNDLGDWYDDVGKHALIYAITEAARNNVRSWPYIERILSNLKAEGCTSEAQLLERKRTRTERSEPSKPREPQYKRFADMYADTTGGR